MGAPADLVGEWRGETDEAVADAPLEVFESNREVIEVFLAADTQWRYVGMEAVPAGLDYSGVRVAAAAIGAEWSARLLDGLKVMERTAVRALIEVRRRNERGRR